MSQTVSTTVPPAAPGDAAAIFRPSTWFGITRAGLLWLLITALFLGIGIGKGINLLVLLAYVLLAVFLLNVLAASRHGRGIVVHYRIADLVFARAPWTLEVDVQNNGPGKPALRIELGGQVHFLSWFLPWLPRRNTKTLCGTLLFPDRGRLHLGPTQAVSGYPFGLFERRRQLEGSAAVVVLPALGWLHRGRFLSRIRGADVFEDAVRRKPRRQPLSQAEFHGLRQFRTGDSPRLIHWRTSARRGELMIREYEDAPGQNLILVFDTRSIRNENEKDATLNARHFEAAVSLAATICWEWCRRRGERLLVAIAGTAPMVFDDLASPDHRHQVLEAFALLESTTEPNAAALLTCLTTRHLPAGALIVIGATPSRLTDMLSQCLQRPAVCFNAANLDSYDFYDLPLDEPRP